jgi:hypothetical protein
MMMAGMGRVCRPGARVMAIWRGFDLPVVVQGRFDMGMGMGMGMGIDRLDDMHPAPQERDDQEQADELGHGPAVAATDDDFISQESRTAR